MRRGVHVWTRGAHLKEQRNGQVVRCVHIKIDLGATRPRETNKYNVLHTFVWHKSIFMSIATSEKAVNVNDDFYLQQLSFFKWPKMVQGWNCVHGPSGNQSAAQSSTNC